MCAPWRFRSARASAHSDQSSLRAQWAAKDARFLHADNKDGAAQASVSLLGAQAILSVLSWCASFQFSNQPYLLANLTKLTFIPFNISFISFSRSSFLAICCVWYLPTFIVMKPLNGRSTTITPRPANIATPTWQNIRVQTEMIIVPSLKCT